jgi:hypothetical protein
MCLRCQAVNLAGCPARERASENALDRSRKKSRIVEGGRKDQRRRIGMSRKLPGLAPVLAIAALLAMPVVTQAAVPRWFINGGLATTRHEPVFFLGETKIHNAILENFACENFVASTLWNEVEEGTERGFEETVGYGTWECKSPNAVKVTNERGVEQEGIFATAEGPPEAKTEKAHKTGSTSLPWTGELTEKEPKAGVHEKYIVTHNLKIWIVIPLCTEMGGTGKGGGCLLAGSEIPFEDREGPEEKAELKFVNGTKNGLSPSKVLGGAGRLESGFGAGFIDDEGAVAGSAGFALVQAK